MGSVQISNSVSFTNLIKDIIVFLDIVFQQMHQAVRLSKSFPQIHFHPLIKGKLQKINLIMFLVIFGIL